MIRSQIARRRLLAEDTPLDQVELAIYLELMGVQIRWLRNQMFRMTQPEFSAASGMPQAQISRIEHGVVDLRFSTLLKIGSILRIPPDQLIPARMAVIRHAENFGFELT